MTAEFTLVCGREHLRAAYHGVYQLGVLIGTPSSGFLADKYGRKLMIALSSSVYVVLGLVTAWLPGMVSILVLRFIMGLAHGVILLVTYILVIEVAEPRRRTLLGLTVYLIWCGSVMAWGGLAYGLREWRWLQTVASLPGVLFLPSLLFIDESPRWLAVRGRYHDAYNVLRKAARITILTSLDFTLGSMVYYGLSLSGDDLSDNPFVYMALAGLMELPSYTLTVPVLEKLGRRSPCVVCFAFCGVTLMLLAAIPAEYTKAVMALALVGKMTNSAAFMIVYYYANELFPTVARSRGVGMCGALSRVGSILAPYVLDFVGSSRPWAASVVFGSVSIIAAISTRLLPETKGCALPDTVKHSETHHHHHHHHQKSGTRPHQQNHQEESLPLCEGSDQVRVSEALTALTRHAALPLEEVHLVGNRIPVLPSRLFGSLMIHKVFLMDNEMGAVSRNAFAGLEASLRHLHVADRALRELPFDTLDQLANLRSLVVQDTQVSVLPRMHALSRLEVLKVEGSRVASIPSSAFKFMPNMKKVHITRSRLRRLEANALEGLVYLKEVNLSGNAIEWVHPNAFRTLASVRLLDLSGNRLQEAASVVAAVREVRELRRLSLSHNGLTRVSRGAFVDLAALEALDLSHNAISRLDGGAFLHLPALRHLDLSGNLLQVMEVQAFPQPLPLRHLALAANNLTEVPGLRRLACIMPHLRSLDLAHNQLARAPRDMFAGHAALEALRLDHNLLAVLQAGTFRDLPSLRELQLSHNQLQAAGGEEGPAWELPSLQQLDLSHNDLQEVGRGLLAGLPSLDALDLSFNLIGAVHSDAFAACPDLRHLNLSYNSLSALPDGLLAGLPRLEVLGLAFNQLTTLGGGALRGAVRLRFLHLHHNNLMGLQQDAFANTSALHLLDLSSNLLQDVPPGVLSPLRSLQVLSLRRNTISRLKKHYLRGLHALHTLDLSHNHLQEVSPAALQDLAGLLDLDLSVNYLQVLHPRLLGGAAGLQRLNASHNYITDLGERSLQAAPSLRVLDLTNNSLTEVGQALRDLPHLQGLYLADNYLTALANHTFAGLPSLTVLRLDNNGIQTFQAATFRDLPDLLTLDMSRNNLVELPPDAFRSLRAVEDLRLAHNQISIVKDFAFTNLPGLLTLQLQDNLIAEIGAHAFHSLPALQFLNLSTNSLPAVPEDALARLPGLHVLDLSANLLRTISDVSLHRLQWLSVLLLHHNTLCHLSVGAFSRQRSLRVLTLQGNHLRRLHLQALGPALSSLSLLDMSDNPFQCDCELVWLKEHLEEAPQGERGPRSLPGRGFAQCACLRRASQIPGAPHHAGNLFNLTEGIEGGGGGLPGLQRPHSPGRAPPLHPPTTPAPSIVPPPPPTSTSPVVEAAAATAGAGVGGLHTTPGDTPTIYAGGSSGVIAADPQESGGGLLSGLALSSLPSLPSLLESVDGGGVSGGAVSKLGTPGEGKPMRGPDANDPVWVDGPPEPHPFFPAPPRPLGGDLVAPGPLSPARGPAPAPDAPEGAAAPRPGLVVSVGRPNVWGTRPSRPKASPVPCSPSHAPRPRPQLRHALPPRETPGGGEPPSTRLHLTTTTTTTTTTPSISPHSLTPLRPTHIPTLPQAPPSSPQHHHPVLVTPLAEGGVGEAAHTPQWSPPEMLHPDSGVSLYQPEEVFLPYEPPDPHHPITVIDAPPPEPPQEAHPSHGTPQITPQITHLTSSPQTTQQHVHPSHSAQQDTHPSHTTPQLAPQNTHPSHSAPQDKHPSHTTPQLAPQNTHPSHSAPQDTHHTLSTPQLAPQQEHPTSFPQFTHPSSPPQPTPQQAHPSTPQGPLNGDLAPAATHVSGGGTLPPPPRPTSSVWGALPPPLHWCWGDVAPGTHPHHLHPH
ncbi:hypothetical protein O3P69_012872 [Scylla paramamosain]|uniref:Major facilitator superfamily (MFS) profile domain-containing protein n=1 Tax=Scylla paramamosain TaxID=85552 RepID=A0AAW0TQB9_SCYPA